MGYGIEKWKFGGFERFPYAIANFGRVSEPYREIAGPQSTQLLSQRHFGQPHLNLGLILTAVCEALTFSLAWSRTVKSLRISSKKAAPAGVSRVPRRSLPKRLTPSSSSSSLMARDRGGRSPRRLQPFWIIHFTSKCSTSTKQHGLTDDF